MKKIAVIIVSMLTVFVIGIACIACASCNYQMIDLNYKFTKAYIKIGEEWQTVEVSQWADYEGEQIQITLKDGTVLVLHSANCILYNGELPKIGE